MTATTDARWKLAAAIAGEVDAVRSFPEQFPWPRNFVDASVMPLVDAYVAERLTEQGETIAKAIEGLVDAHHDAYEATTFGLAADTARELGKHNQAAAR